MVESKAKCDNRAVKPNVTRQDLAERSSAIESTVLDPGEVITDESVAEIGEVSDAEGNQENRGSSDRRNGSHEVLLMLIRSGFAGRASHCAKIAALDLLLSRNVLLL